MTGESPEGRVMRSSDTGICYKYCWMFASKYWTKLKHNYSSIYTMVVTFWPIRLLYRCINHLSVCTKGSRFPYILLIAQEVRVYFVAMITLRHAPAHKRLTYMRLIYHVCDYIIFSIYSTIARLYWAPLIFAYGAEPPKVSGPSEGHGGEQHTIA